MIDFAIHSVAVHRTPLGPMWSRWSDRGLFQFDWNQPDDPTEFCADANAERQIESFDALLQEFYQEGQTSFDSVAIDPTGWTEFTTKIYQACRQINPGTTLTYKQLAEAAGNVNASRAVGAAMARNRVLVVIPCHRVVSSGGDLRGFSAPGGITTKRSLLELERVGCWPADLFAVE